MPEVICTAVAVQNSSEWPCSMCPISKLRLVGVRTSYIYFSNISWTPGVLGPITNPIWGPLLAAPCYSILHNHSVESPTPFRSHTREFL